MSVVAGKIELTGTAHTGDRKIVLKASPEVEGAHSRVPGDGGADESTLDLELTC